VQEFLALFEVISDILVDVLLLGVELLHFYLTHHRLIFARHIAIVGGVNILYFFTNSHNLVSLVVVSPLNSSPAEMRFQVVVPVELVLLHVIYLRAHEQVVLRISARDVLEVKVVQLVVPLVVAL
jgi:hypothetical protein